MQAGPTHYHKSIVLDDASLLPPAASCPWCGGLDRQAGATIQKQPEVMLLECSTCHASSASRMPTPQALDAYYGNYYDGASAADHAQAEGRVTIGDAARMGAHLASSLGSTEGKTSLRILDFGGGDGMLAVLAAENFMKVNPTLREVAVTVVDYNTQMHQPANPAITVRGSTKLTELGDSTYDFVIASAILEHIPDCAGLLRDLLTRVASGGSFYLRTPYAAPFMRLAETLGKSWDFTFPAHVHDLGQAFWEGYFTANGNEKLFSIKSSRPSIVQASMSERPVEAIISHLFKLPWHLLGRAWGFVGGWEITVTRR